MPRDLLIIITARDEADRIEVTLRALGRAFPRCPVWVGDDGSIDDTAACARACGAHVVRQARRVGKGAAATRTAEQALESLAGGADPIVLLCDGDLGESASRLTALTDAVAAGQADLAVAAFAASVGGGFGLVLGYARRAIARGAGLRLRAPLSGQRAMRASTLRGLLPFAGGFGMEVAMTLDAARTGGCIVEVELDLQHRATGRTVAGFLHRARQLVDVVRAVRCRRRRARR
jgi:glycosyltransferase involved in cell wall biosynthesis